MRRMLFLIGGVLLMLSVTSCATRDTAREAAEEQEVRRAFAQLQAALVGGDADRLWEQFDEALHDAAERKAAEARAAYAKASAEERAALAKDMQLDGDEPGRVTGKGMLRTRKFRELYEEIPDATVLAVEVKGDWATVWYREEDGEEEKALFHREDGRWKASMPMK